MQSPWRREPSGQSQGPHPEKSCQPEAPITAHTLQLGWCIPHEALEFSQLIYQILYLEGEEKNKSKNEV